MGSLRQRIAADLRGVHLALNVFVATSLLWLVIRKWAGLNPIWAISAMLASSDPHVVDALKSVRGRVINAALGCAIGLTFLTLGGSRDWKLPMALAATAFLSSYIVRVPVMWRQAPDHRGDRRRLGNRAAHEGGLDRDRPAPGGGGPLRLSGGAGRHLADLEDLADAGIAAPQALPIRP